MLNPVGNIPCETDLSMQPFLAPDLGNQFHLPGEEKINENGGKRMLSCVLSTHVKPRVGKNIINFMWVGNESLSILTDALVYTEKHFVRLMHNPFKIITLNHIYFRGL